MRFIYYFALLKLQHYLSACRQALLWPVMAIDELRGNRNGVAVGILVFCCLVLSIPMGFHFRDFIVKQPITVPAMLFSGTSATTQTVFTPLHTYFMAASGCNDANAGTSAGSPWCSPNHAVVCGDVIIAAPGTYNGSLNTWGAVSTCPSTTGGIDGTGGIYTATLVCNGNLGSCVVNCSTGTCAAGHVGSGGRTAPTAGMNVNSSNWAVEGWQINGNGAGQYAFQADACLTTSTILGYIAFINDIAINAGDGFNTAECGYGHTVPGNGVDEWAVVGSIAQNANLAAICVGAIDDVAFANLDSLAGTHVALIGNFAIANSNNPTCTASDGEGIIIDSPDVHGYTSSTAIFDNVVYSSSWAGLQVFQQTFNSSSPTFNIFNNTLFNDMVCPDFTPGSTGEINLQINGNFPWTINTYNNIARTNRATQPFGSTCSSTATSHPYAMLASAGAAVTIATGGSGINNVFFGTAASCDNGSNCAGSNSVIWFNSATFSANNTYTDPLFTNTSDLLTNWVGVPSCSSFTNVASCMGWNYISQAATTLTPISDLTATAGAASGKGYRPPKSPASNALYPTWLKGIVYLTVSGSTIYENAGLVNQPPGT